MKRPYILAALALGVSLSLCSCSSKDKDIISPDVEKIEASDSNNSEVSENVNAADAVPTEGMVRSRITNEWVTEDVNNARPIAVMIPNSSTASYYGLSKASVLYECNVEGSMTRLMAIIDDWQSLNKIGNIRSARDYYIYWGFEWDSIFIHYGGPFYINDVISRDDTQNINCISSNEAYYREEAKNTTDDCFTNAEMIKTVMEEHGYTSEYRSGYSDPQHYMFASDDMPNTLDQYNEPLAATKIDMSRCYPVTNCYFVYNSEKGTYDRYQNLSGSKDGPHIDEATGEQLSFANIIVQNTYHEVRDQKGYLAFQVHDDTRDGWFFTKGKGIHINWKKISDYGATRYYDDDGNEILFNTGKTMVLIVEDGDSFTVDDKIVTSSK